MKTHFFYVMLIGAILSSCSDYTSIPPSVYGQNRNLIEKPVYEEENASMIHMAGAFSNLDLKVYGDDDQGNTTVVGDGGNITSGLLEVSYSQAYEKFSYGVGLMAATGQYSGEFVSFGPRAGQSISTSGFGIKGNISLDKNTARYTGRLVQGQFGFSREFGDYSSQRFEVDYDSLYVIDVLNYPDQFVVDFSISHQSQFRIEDVRIGIGVGINFSAPNAFGDWLVTSSLFIKPQIGYKMFDLYYMYGTDEVQPVGNTHILGLAYRFSL